MDLREIQKLVAQQEHKALEFKKSTAQLKSAMDSLCGFLNHKGGTVLFGVTPEQKIVGQMVGDKTQQEIAHALTLFAPSAPIEVAYIPLPDKPERSVIALTAKPHLADQPYTYDGRPYVRTENTKGQMSQHDYHALLERRGMRTRGWEMLPADHHQIKDLDKERIHEFILLGIEKGRFPASFVKLTSKQALSKLHLLPDEQPINAAVVLFTKEPGNYYPQCLIRLARFRSKEKENILDMQHVTGNASTLIEAAENFIYRHLPLPAHVEGMRRIDTPLFPVKVIREVLVNAIAHRDYNIVGGSISVFIYDDRIEVTSHGNLPAGVNIESLKRLHESTSRNPALTQALYLGGLIDKAGMGTLEIVKGCREAGQPTPQFFERDNTFVVCLRSKIPIGAPAVETPPAEEGDMLPPLQQEILKLFSKHNTMTTEEVLLKLKHPPAVRTVRHALTQLKNQGYIDSQGRGASAFWLLKKS